MPDKRAVLWLNSPDEIIEKVIERKDYNSKWIRQWREIVMGNPFEASKKMEEVIKFEK
jgi:hypothetical protein